MAAARCDRSCVGAPLFSSATVTQAGMGTGAGSKRLSRRSFVVGCDTRKLGWALAWGENFLATFVPTAVESLACY